MVVQMVAVKVEKLVAWKAWKLVVPRATKSVDLAEHSVVTTDGK
jgi:hypothetical protein